MTLPLTLAFGAKPSATRAFILSILCVGTVAGIGSSRGAPPGYYDTVDTTNAATLRVTLHAVVDDHTRFPYTSSATDTWDILNLASEDPSDSANILDVYRNQSLAKQPGGNSFYDREHTWPNSYGFPDDNASNYPFTDCHMLFLCDIGYNSSRSNKPYRFCSAACSERVTVLTNGTGGGSGVYPGNSNWTSGSLTQGTWETWVGRRGDVARAILYADIRYEGGAHGITGIPEPDLRATDNQSLIAASNTGNNESIAYMGMLSALIEWHEQDPPDAWEQHRNDVVANFQGNRNPFVDHPEWVACLFESACGIGSSFCYGDGSLATPCPCVPPNTVPNPSGAAGHGCANSFDLNGAVLSASGVLAPDTVQFTCAIGPSYLGYGFLVKGSASNPAGVASSDGVICVSGSLVRFGGHNAGTNGAPTGSWTYPNTVQTTPVSVASAQAPGQHAYYQLFYRNAAASFCSDATANLSNALELVWP